MLACLIRRVARRSAKPAVEDLRGGGGSASRSYHRAPPQRLHAAAFALAVSALPLPASAQTGPEWSVVMVLPRAEGPVERAFKEYIAKSGATLHATMLPWSGRPEDRAALRARLRMLRPDLVYTWGTQATLAVAGPLQAPPGGDDAIRDIPVVFASVGDPVAAGLVASLARPGRNVTGVSHLAPLAAQFGAMRAWRPLRRLGFLYDPVESDAVTLRGQIRAQARAAHVELVEEPLAPDSSGEPDPAAIPAAVARLRARGAEMLYMGPDPLVGITYADLVTAAALDAGLPTFSPLEAAVRRSNALFGLVSTESGVGRMAASKALDVLSRRVPAASEPVESLPAFSLLVDMNAARQLRSYPPLRLLEVADVLGAE